MVGDLALGKARVEWEVGRLKSESDSLVSLLSLFQNFYNPVPLSKPNPKKKKRNIMLSSSDRPKPLI